MERWRGLRRKDLKEGFEGRSGVNVWWEDG